MTRRPRGMRLLAIALTAAVLAGCSTSAQDLPLPGSRVHGPSYRLTAEFEDALNLADGAAVKLHGVPIGRVREISVHDFTARVTIDVEESRPLPRGTTARLRSTTPLGELFVQIDEPARAGRGVPRLADGDVLGTDRTSVAPTIEDTMSAASLLVNGGGLGQLETIVEEANHVLGGREGTVRDALRRVAQTARSLNDADPDIDAALRALARVSTILDRRRDVVVAALRDVRPAAHVLRDNTGRLTELLTSVDHLSRTVVDVIGRSREDLEAVLGRISPVLEELNTVRSRLGPGLQTVIGLARLLDRAVPAEYLNAYVYFQTEVSLGVPSLPLVGDTGLPSLTLPPSSAPAASASPSGAVPSAPAPAPTATPLDLGLGGLLGGGR